MGQIVRLADARARKTRMREAERAAAGEPSARPRGFEAVDCGSGWYHGAAIETSKDLSPKQH